MEMLKIFLIFSLSLILSKDVVAQFKDSSDILDVNFPALLSRADLTYTKPVSRSEEGMPIGNGTMGSLVWTTPSTLRFQINRVDVFANNSASNSFFERHTDYCGGIGFADIDFVSASEEAFSEKNFRQHLSCYDGLVTVNGNGISASILAWNEQDVMAVQLEDKRSNPGPILAQLRALRLPITKKGNHMAISSVKVIDKKIVLMQEFREDSYYCGSALVIEIQGRDTKAEKASESSVRLVSAGGNNKFTVFMASTASFDPKEDLVNAAIKKLDSAKSKGYEGLLQSNKDWWHDFWNRSFVHLHSSDGIADLMEEHYNYYIYVMASSSRGAFPAKFNGMLWTTGGDERKWGTMFWGANQSCLYNALFPTNRIELMDPMFNMYTSMYDDCAVAAQQQWGSKGIFIGETVSFDGIPALPEHIALELRALYLGQKPWKERSQEFSDYALTKLPFLSRWNWKEDDGWREGRWYTSDKGGGPFGHVTHIFSRGAKIAYQYWLRYEYTKDEIWLRDKAYPIIKGVAEFYRNFPNVKKEQDGNYHIYNVNDNESIWGGHNTIEELSAMMGIFPVVIRAAEILNVDTDLRSVWREFLDNLSPLPLSTDYSKSDGGSKIKWVRSLLPVVQGNGDRLPDRNTLPVWFFDLCNLESDPKMLAIANTTFDAYFPKGITENTTVNVLSKLPVAGSILGRVESTRYLITNQIRTTEIEVLRNRMDLREGVQTTSIQRLGRAAEALNFALCQSVTSAPGEVTIIRVFPAWPPEWDAQFTLLCRDAFVVTSSMKNGEIEFVEVASQAGSSCNLRNPWTGKEVSIYRNGKKWKNTSNALLQFPTKKNDRFIIVEKNDTPAQFKRMLLVE